MEKDKTATETNAQPIATEETIKISAEDDLEAKNKALEDEKNKLIEESANYKMAYLKEKRKNKESFDDLEETEEEKMRRYAREALAESRIAEIDREKQANLDRALKENKELKLAQLNKTTVSTVVGTHSESQAVRDTLVTQEQVAAFKARGWTDQDIERYKRNLLKNTR